MQKNFNEKVNLEELAREVAYFFEDRKFEDITALRTDSGSQVLAGHSRTYKIKGNLQIDIAEIPGGFSVDLKHPKEPRRFNFPMTLMTMFGGGYFLLKDLKSDEAVIKLEREFWSDIGKMISRSKESLGEI